MDRPTGRISRRWAAGPTLLSAGGGRTAAPYVVWKKGFVALAPVFRAPGWPWVVGREALLGRAAAAFGDVMSQDLAARDGLVLRGG